MRSYKDHLILSGSTVKQSLSVLNELSQDAIIFVVDESDRLIGSLTDGDIRRGLLNDFNVDSLIDEIIEQRGLKQITDIGALEALVDEVLQANAKSVEEFKSGKEKAFNALVGQIMKASQGKANPGQVNELLRKKLG